MRRVTARHIRGVIAAALVTAPLAVAAQTPPANPPPAERAKREDALRSIEQSARANADARQRLEREIATLRADQPALSAALVEAGRGAQEAEARALETEARLDRLAAREAEIRGSLQAHQGVLGDVLAGLQRLGRGPPALLLARPGDLLKALRGATLMNAVTPVLRDQVRALVADLEELRRLQNMVAVDRAVLGEEYARLAAERDRLSALIRARGERLARAESDVRRERNRGDRLSEEAKSIRDLLAEMEAEAARAQARDAEQRALADVEARETRQRIAEAERAEPAKLSPRRPFAEAKGSLLRPAVGSSLKEFGSPDGSGGAMRGLAIGTRPRAAVTSPAEGTVVFAGPFRAYGRILIINLGSGYYLLLAGMASIHVEAGQFVLAGEPVAQMGDAAAPAAALGVVEGDAPVLYVELRKDGAPIDPGPWWARSQSERARG